MKNFKSISSIILFATVLLITGCEKAQIEPEASSAGVVAEQLDESAAKQPDDQQAIEALPEFKLIFGTGLSGNGVVQKFLLADGRNLSGTADSHDSQLIDTSVISEEESVEAIKNALEKKEHAIIDGGETQQSSDKMNRIMQASVGFSVPRALAYVVSKQPSGAFNVTPLLTLPDEKGIIELNQLTNYFTTLEN